jgi:hypothetical protein
LPYASLDALKTQMRLLGVTRLYAKYLRRNNTSRQQIYIAKGDWGALHMLPIGDIRHCAGDPDVWTPTGHRRDNLKGDLPFKWLDDRGNCFDAPRAQLILYPKYPEIRLGSLLREAEWAPSDLLNQAVEGRVLFLGVQPAGYVVAYLAAHDSPVAREFAATLRRPGEDLLIEIPLPGLEDSRLTLLSALRRVHEKCWIRSRRLAPSGTIEPCESSQCVGFTLEAELGIGTNAFTEPDYLGWEVKAYQVPDVHRYLLGGRLSLFTPEPDGGFYAEKGLEEFLRRFGYPDTHGKADRLNFGGTHRVGKPVDNRGKGGCVSELRLRGYDAGTDSIPDISDCALELWGGPNCQILLASWSCTKLLSHWQRKHQKAVYVPAEVRLNPREYRYGDVVRLGEGTDIRRLLRAIWLGNVVLDPAHKLERASSSRPRVKARTQFRIDRRDLCALYRSFEDVSVIDGSPAGSH